MNNVEVFLDTQKRIKKNRRLMHLTEQAVSGTRIYPEGYRSDNSPIKRGKIEFQENLTLIAASRFSSKESKTAVLNFANPIEEGGGVLRGANAQEEYLCRASNLYNCLRSKNAADWYQVHNDMAGISIRDRFLATDSLIYSPNVTVFKKDVGYKPDADCSPMQKYTFKWMNVDVITCAAPLFVHRFCLLSDEVLKNIFISRIKNIFEAAIDNGVDALILGAFGCGVFHNPPNVVADAFNDVLSIGRYATAFGNVVFAVKRTGPECGNINAFRARFT